MIFWLPIVGERLYAITLKVASAFEIHVARHCCCGWMAGKDLKLGALWLGQDPPEDALLAAPSMLHADTHTRHDADMRPV